VPEEWVDDVRKADEDTLFDMIAHLPQEAQEALLKLAVGEQPEAPKPAPVDADPFAHPDAQRRFRILANAEELQRALDDPWEKWAVFLHPDQAALVERDFSGPARVSGSAGTGKTIVALHRAVHLARANPTAKVLLTTFSNALANALGKPDHLIGNEPLIAARIVVKSVTSVGHDLYAQAHGQPDIASEALNRALLAQSATGGDGSKFSPQFLFGEWTDVVDAWQLTTWDAYAQVSRLGRKTRIGGKQREALWGIFDRVRAGLAERKSVTWSGIFGRLPTIWRAAPSAPSISRSSTRRRISASPKHGSSAHCAARPNALFFAGDLGQRIFQQPFSWESFGIDVRGRSYPLRINYRTSHQIRIHADGLLPNAIGDVDGNAESRRGTVSVFDGPPPLLQICADANAEQRVVAEWVAARLREGYQPEEIGVFVRSEAQIERARAAVTAAGTSVVELTDQIEVTKGRVAIGTMHLAKGLEFRAVAVVACDDEVLPLQERIEAVSDDAELEDVYNTERHLLYVACTRARDHLLVTSVAPA
jgi:hypothetical protein